MRHINELLLTRFLVFIYAYIYIYRQHQTSLEQKKRKKREKQQHQQSLTLSRTVFMYVTGKLRKDIETSMRQYGYFSCH